MVCECCNLCIETFENGIGMASTSSVGKVLTSAQEY